MGNGVPNQAPFGHYQGGHTSPVGYFFIYHDQQVTGNDWPMSPEMSPSAYGALRNAAGQGQAAFENELAGGAWATFFSTYSGIDKALARTGVLHTE